MSFVFCPEGDQLIPAWSSQWWDLVIGKTQAGDAFIWRVALFSYEGNIVDKKSLSWDNMKTTCLTLFVCPLAQIHRDALVGLLLRRQFSSNHLCLRLEGCIPSILGCCCNSWTQSMQSYGLILLTYFSHRFLCSAQTLYISTTLYTSTPILPWHSAIF